MIYSLDIDVGVDVDNDDIDADMDELGYQGAEVVQLGAVF
jgi:hypothetical protein